jgi:3-dehydroquinate synthase
VQIEVQSASGAYPVVIAPGALTQLAELVPPASMSGLPAVVSSAPIWRRHGARLRDVMGRRPPILIPDGERAKTLTVVRRLYGHFGRRALDRSSVVVAFGGGVVGDVAGFAAATYLRGLRVVQIPTTLLAQVDSAIGGKVGVNLETGKNLVGAFHPPALVLCDPAVLLTLPPREFRSGLYEVIKYGVIASAPLFDRVSADLDTVLTQAPEVTTPIIAACCRIKAEVVTADERESGHRRVLNFGHTVGHALEAITGYRRFRHGEAIAHGMLAAAHISHARGALGAEELRRLTDVIRRTTRLPSVRDLRVGRALEVIRRDKKVDRGRLHFVLARGIGGTSIVTDVGDAELTAAMRRIGMKA